MTSPGDPIYIAAQIIQACEQGVHNPQLIPRTDQIAAARLILKALTPDVYKCIDLIDALNQFPTTQPLFPNP